MSGRKYAWEILDAVEQSNDEETILPARTLKSELGVLTETPVPTMPAADGPPEPCPVRDMADGHGFGGGRESADGERRPGRPSCLLRRSKAA